ncbi:MAG: hypothetical protein JRI25_24740, partial [Deltaproteobacteria bacterium]|nr:hypothetical protein [Deltaproteobacteria bacterium]
GELTSEPWTCSSGSIWCFTLTHGGAMGEELILRTWDNDILAKGDCIEVYGTMSEYQGDSQFDALQRDWFRWYGSTGR